MSASLNWMPWSWLIGFPNAIRSFEYWFAKSVAPWAMPTACAAAPSRVRSSTVRATDRPFPSAPTMFAAGTRTSVNDGEPGGVGKRRGAGGGAPDSELVLELARVEAGAVLLHDEGRHAAALPIGLREDDVEVRDRGVRDPVLLAVDHPLVAVADGGGAHGRRVRAGFGLRQRERRRPLARRAA